MARIFQPSDGYIFEYQQALIYEELQADINWTAKEIAVEDDINDLKIHATASERHGILHTLKLFTHYELIAGDEYWGGRFKRMFPRHEFRRMAAQFTQVELCVHAPFYDKINEVLLLKTPEFYNSWKENTVLRDRMAFINDCVTSESHNGLLSLAVFSMVEGAILYSSFAYLKSFKKQGKNRIPNIVSGINFSVRDENLHSEAGAWAYRTAASELGFSKKEIADEIEYAAMEINRHESEIIDEVFSEGPVDGITPHQCKEFVGQRLDLCLSNLGFDPIFKTTDFTIANWFYDDISGMRSTDHFATLSPNYSRKWNEQKFYY